MPSPFPGMNPYLEDRLIWPDVHPSLIPAIRDALAPQVAPHYYVAIEQRVTTVEVARGEGVREPDVAIVPTRPVPVPSGGVAVAMAPAGAGTRGLSPIDGDALERASGLLVVGCRHLTVSTPASGERPLVDSPF